MLTSCILAPAPVYHETTTTLGPSYPVLFSSCYDAAQTVDKIAKALVGGILAISLVTARADVLWAGNSPLLNFAAGQKNKKQAVWLRRLLLLEVMVLLTWPVQ